MLVGLVIVPGCSLPPGDLAESATQRAHTQINPQKARAAEIKMMMRVLSDPRLETIRRQQAAVGLVGSGDGQADSWLAGRLNPDQEPTALGLVLRALLSSEGPPPLSCAGPLWALLEHTDESVRYQAAVALGRYTQPEIVKRLIATAQDGQAAVWARVGAITALGCHTEQEVVAVQIKLMGLQHPPAIQRAAMSALAQLTGIRGYGRDQWSGWWKQHGHLSKEQWHRSLLVSLSGQNARLAVESRYISEQLIDLQRQLYRTSGQPDRPGLLVKMLADPFDKVRRLAIALCEQRLIDNQPIDGPLREVLVRRLEDPSAENRRRVALLMRDLVDESAADAVAELVVSQQEQDVEALRAYLLLLARLPRAVAVPQILQWLGEPERGLSIEAAGAVASAAKQGMLDAGQTGLSAKWARKLVDGQGVPDPALVELLGRVGGDEDWRWIEQWLSNGNDAVKRAAAEALADSNQPLGVLMQHAGDPVIEPVAIAVARRRGFGRETLDALIAHKPDGDQAVQGWRLAVVAVAGRVSPKVVVEADRRLGELGEPAELRGQVLSEAIGRLTAKGGGHNGVVNGGYEPPVGEQGVTKQPAPDEARVLIDLLLARAGLRVAGGELGQAQTDYQWLDDLSPSMSSTQRREHKLGMLRMRLTAGTGDDVEQALLLAQRLLGPSGDGAGVAVIAGLQEIILDAFLSTADRLASAGQLEPARSMLVRLAEVIGSVLPGELERRLAALDQQLASRPVVKKPAAGGGGAAVPGDSTPRAQAPTISDSSDGQQPQP